MTRHNDETDEVSSPSHYGTNVKLRLKVASEQMGNL